MPQAQSDTAPLALTDADFADFIDESSKPRMNTNGFAAIKSLNR
jgi:hypothetical protein